ncbi:proline-rich receptor-like protein kinase PERK9 [Canna indica]|uniref:Proline-rich receptor-like protein kinase PERK9 n=1 Tax=Canna indica TaxID=4628 RepID=A0AAQ3KD10_9LILI|nr:proline-rich receptor-like protein kinase PERK9 [Canna indica]
MAASPRAPPSPPVIGKAGSFTVFISPPSKDLGSRIETPAPTSNVGSPDKVPPLPAKAPPSPPHPPVVVLPPVQVPPLQFEKPASKSPGSMFGFLRDAVVKVQDAHSSLDEYLADWLGLDHSKYQWALNDYYESKGKKMENSKVNKPKVFIDKGRVA